MHSFERSGYVFDVTEGGDPNGQPVVLLHGFPQDRGCWAELSEQLQQRGYRTLAPDLRGAAQGARPLEVGQYRTAEHVRDVVALLDAAGLERAHVVGHDWGGYLAWALGCAAPERLLTLTSLSTPHPAAFKRAALRSAQGLRSWYMGLFQVPHVSERLLAPGSALWRAAVRGLPPQHKQAYARRMADPAARTAALNWYRVQPRELATPSIEWSRVAVPALYVWGERDPALSRAAAEATARYATGRYRFEPIDAGHWLPETRPVLLANLLADHFGAA